MGNVKEKLHVTGKYLRYYKSPIISLDLMRFRKDAKGTVKIIKYTDIIEEV